MVNTVDLKYIVNGVEKVCICSEDTDDSTLMLMLDAFVEFVKPERDPIDNKRIEGED